ncbi:hypothetical protein SARC_05176 [Sphaeroforma arctica JP610]|uniref:Fe2OG dioxygenase domain-containing protein n=1 Tax=Sphaeroforma arctica JP610 TaxID=667725 RepID=A0A0L0G2V9_9EUKA|nr:hypothetical protein SARC_05176 [Sphaeroforma arctica JP610]KNC82528.1 hypothetical protein SARC_05176 [Sphaeroforma arctica JP610]|eukprot:XP_014156430.1 hypothetical protein SARC_05176 [Sphaeroforma arctica JP610]
MIRHQDDKPIIEGHLIEGAPPSLYCVFDFISADQETLFLSKIYDGSKKWTSLLNRRLQNWGGLPSHKGMVKEGLPQWLTEQCENLSAGSVFPSGQQPNHVLVNEYLPGQGILPHEDGPVFSPTIATVTLRSHCLLEFYPHRRQPDKDDPQAGAEAEDGTEAGKDDGNEPEFKIYLPPRSLFVVKDDCYRTYLHGISDTSADIVDEKVLNRTQSTHALAINEVLERGTRVSMTIRHVPKVMKESVQQALMARLLKR